VLMMLELYLHWTLPWALAVVANLIGHTVFYMQNIQGCYFRSLSNVTHL
jgi:hypothetical protein